MSLGCRGTPKLARLRTCGGNRVRPAGVCVLECELHAVSERLAAAPPQVSADMGSDEWSSPSTLQKDFFAVEKLRCLLVFHAELVATADLAPLFKVRTWAE